MFQKRLFSIILLLIIINYQLTSSFTIWFINRSITSFNEYYWLKPGVYFEYIVYGVDSPNIILIDKLHDRLIIVNYLLIKWIVLNKSDRFAFIEYRISSNNVTVLDIENNVLENSVFEFKWNFVIDLDTLDAYSDNLDKWIGEWPYLLNNIQSSERSLKMIYVKTIDSKCSIDMGFFKNIESLTSLLKLNETLIKLSNGSSFLKQNRFSNTVELTDKYVSFIELYPSSSNYTFRFKNTILSGNRIVFGRSLVSFYIPDKYIELFNKIYNSSSRPIYFTTLTTIAKNYTVMIDDKGEVYCMIPPFITRLLYDSYSKILLNAYGMVDNIIYIITGFKTIVNEYIAPYFTCLYERGYLELHDTNIEFNRNVNTGIDNIYSKWYFIVILTCILVTTVIFVTIILKHVKLRK
uniref:Uncharacterized protein n=1 Tax=Staphylothermus marinus TaxID=2280 RepID=A0A7C4D8S8_STAMA